MDFSRIKDDVPLKIENNARLHNTSLDNTVNMFKKSSTFYIMVESAEKRRKFINILLVYRSTYLSRQIIMKTVMV
jgi:hypothetical protein